MEPRVKIVTRLARRARLVPIFPAAHPGRYVLKEAYIDESKEGFCIHSNTKIYCIHYLFLFGFYGYIESPSDKNN